MSKSKLKYFNKESRAWRISARLYSPCVYYTPVILDALVLWALNRRAAEREGRPSYTGPGLVRGDDRELYEPLRKLIWHDSYCAVCTQMMPAAGVIDIRETIKKRFETRYQHLIDFGRHRRRISTQAAPYRNYDKSMPGRLVDRVFWEFIGDGPAVLELLQTQVVGVGKDVNAGYGWVDYWSLKEADTDRVGILKRRPIPLFLAERYGITGRVEVRSWMPPYWARNRLDECVVPDEV